jgi:hypothetical protein
VLKYHISFVIAAKRPPESQAFFMEKTWTDVAEKRHHTASSNCSQISTETEKNLYLSISGIQDTI